MATISDKYGSWYVEDGINCVNRLNLTPSNIYTLQSLNSELIKHKLPLYRFGVLSDTHYYKDYNAVNKTKSAINSFKSRGAEFICHCGDVGTFKVIEPETIGRNIVDFCNYANSAECGIPIYAVKGNHDISTQNQPWIDNIKTQPNFTFTKNNDMFIFLSMDYCATEQIRKYTEAIAFLKTLNVTNKRCFLFIHYPWYNTCGTRQGEVYGFEQNNLEQYEIYNYFSKNLVAFSGHSHYKLEVQTILQQYNMNVFLDSNSKTSISCPSVGYARDENGILISAQNVVQGWICDVYADGVRVIGIDLYNNKLLNEYTYYIKTNL